MTCSFLKLYIIKQTVEIYKMQKKHVRRNLALLWNTGMVLGFSLVKVMAILFP